MARAPRPSVRAWCGPPLWMMFLLPVAALAAQDAGVPGADAAAPTSPAAGPGMPRPPLPGVTRVVTYNIAALSQDPDAVVRTLEALAPHVVALQEVDRKTLRGRGVDQAQWLADQLHMHQVFAPTIPLEGGEYGLAVLSRSPVTLVKAHALPRLGQEEPRMALEARTTTAAGEPFTVVNTHLAANWRAVKPDEIRRAQARALARILGKIRGPTVLLGDFNTSREVLAPLLGKPWTPAGAVLPTYPAPSPLLALDQVWTPPKVWRVNAVEAVAASGSDHLPLVVDLALLR